MEMRIPTLPLFGDEDNLETRLPPRHSKEGEDGEDGEDGKDGRNGTGTAALANPSGAGNPGRSREETFNDYEGFVEKFKPKKTTDDCYTPDYVYEEVYNWVSEKITPLDGVEVVRPFYPGGDYENFDYPEGCVVLDNPPFSIIAKIRRFYHQRGIKYFLFAPALTLASSARELAGETTYILCSANITYGNGAIVRTSFVTNMDCGGVAVWLAGDLTERIHRRQERERREDVVKLPKYVYPMEVLHPAAAGRLVERGIELKIYKGETHPVASIESQRGQGKSIFGGGWFISERAAAERAAAEEITVWELSEEEWRIVKGLRRRDPENGQG